MKNIKSKPTKLEVLEVLTKRSFYPNRNEMSELKRLRAGYEGEKVVVDYLKKHGKSHWTLLQNIWLEYVGTLECDGILFTGSDLFVLEIKHYSGLYEYENGLSKLNNRELSVNPIYQTRKATMKVRELVCSRFSNVKVHGVLIFVGIDSEIKIASDVRDIEIVQRHELRGFIEKISAEEVNGRRESVNPNQIIKLIRKHLTENPYPVEPPSAEVLDGLQKGIFCERCANSTVNVTKKFVKCSCGTIESREKATVRTICEYGVLNFTKDLTVNDLIDFFNGQASKTYLNKILRSYFKLLSRGRQDYYENNIHLYTENYKYLLK